jgi:ADP-heptose:LPS heptosyltransferase
VTDFTNILVIKWGALGDLVAATPAIRALRESFPSATVTLLSNALMKQICPPGSIVDDVIVYNGNEVSTSQRLFSQIKLVRELRKRRFDIAINLRPESERSALLAWLSGAGQRLGSGPRALQFLYTIKAPAIEGKRHEIHRNGDIVKVLGIGMNEETPYVFRSHRDDAFRKEFFQNNELQNRHILGIHPGASKKEKMWPAKRFIEIGKQFIEEFRQPVLVTWGPGEEQLARSVARSLDSYGILSEPTRTIGQLAALIEGCRMFFCNCSGPMNVAMAVKTPIVALLGASHPEDWGPYGEMHRTIKSSFTLDSYTNEQEQHAMECITVDEVWDVLSKRWVELSPLSEGAKVRA